MILDAAAPDVNAVASALNQRDPSGLIGDCNFAANGATLVKNPHHTGKNAKGET
jgi:hypothetical protein